MPSAQQPVSPPVSAQPVSPQPVSQALASQHPVPLQSFPSLARRKGPLDAILGEADRALRVLAGASSAGRPYPAGPEAAETLTPSDRRHAAGLMRVNHVGEICAQALYRGQALGCTDASAHRMLHDAAAEEVDHLAWCERRLGELRSRPSLLNPLWYAGSFGLGLLASRAGVRRNLGFMAETERQVEAHLDSHLKRLPAQDERSRQVVDQMKQDEINHRVAAERAGAASLSWPVRGAMRALSRVMTGTAYWI